MMWGEYFGLAVTSLTHRRTRTLLTVIGIVIGITAVVALLSVGQGLQDGINEQFATLGVDKVTIFSSTAFSAAAGASATPLTDRDVRAIENTRGVAEAAGVVLKATIVKFRDEPKQLSIYGYPLDSRRRLMEESSGYEIDAGRKLGPNDHGKVVVGSYVADGVFKRKVGVGSALEFQGQRFTVVGTLKSVGNRQDDSAILMGLDEVREVFAEDGAPPGDVVYSIIARVAPGEVPATVATRIEDRLRKSHNIKKGEETFSVMTSEQLMQSFNAIFGIVQAVIIGIAAISLLVGGIGIMNTMYTAVIERTKEIGIMKAVGARNSAIMAIFVIESGLLGAVGGVIGVILGAGAAKLVEFVATNALGSNLLRAALPWELLVGALLFSFTIGACSGLFPARQAARLKPVDALRYE
ncbi:hypothetical protein AUJ14_00180 [Candidatus Micrarchaeota archaeon CG1_02_55_22]|nr:MAG: hypothetical protein AUJ14_00180 [Candidatus Micrarchaeota archaeon CG1_02_55_22]